MKESVSRIRHKQYQSVQVDCPDSCVLNYYYTNACLYAHTYDCMRYRMHPIMKALVHYVVARQTWADAVLQYHSKLAPKEW